MRGWVAVGVLVLSSSLNYLDRMVLSALMPTLRRELKLGGEDIGLLVAAFSIVYGLASPAMGLVIDRVGLRIGAAAMVAMWSAAGMATGLASTFAGLLVCRAALGFAEAGGIPSTAKGYALYLPAKERALGAAAGQAGLTLGVMSAPVLTEWLAVRYGWRSAFVVSGALGFAWIPLWLWVSARTQPLEPARVTEARTPIRAMFRDRRYAGLVAANMLAMTVYSLWTTWTTDFLVTTYGLTQSEANLRYVWIPPIFATLGGLCGGWLALRLIRGGVEPAAARLRIATWSAAFCVLTAWAPAAGSAAAAVAAICISFFALTALSVNYYALPLDLFGAGRAALAVSMLTGVFGLMQAMLAPQIGGWSDRVGWQPVCTAVAFLPLASALLLRAAFRRS